MSRPFSPIDDSREDLYSSSSDSDSDSEGYPPPIVDNYWFWGWLRSLHVKEALDFTPFDAVIGRYPSVLPLNTLPKTSPIPRFQKDLDELHSGVRFKCDAHEDDRHHLGLHWADFAAARCTEHQLQLDFDSKERVRVRREWLVRLAFSSIDRYDGPGTGSIYTFPDLPIYLPLTPNASLRHLENGPDPHTATADLVVCKSLKMHDDLLHRTVGGSAAASELHAQLTQTQACNYAVHEYMLALLFVEYGAHSTCDDDEVCLRMRRNLASTARFMKYLGVFGVAVYGVVVTRHTAEVYFATVTPDGVVRLCTERLTPYGEAANVVHIMSARDHALLHITLRNIMNYIKEVDIAPLRYEQLAPDEPWRVSYREENARWEAQEREERRKRRRERRRAVGSETPGGVADAEAGDGRQDNQPFRGSKRARRSSGTAE